MALVGDEWRQWEEDAGVVGWLRPGEHVLWRGRPDPAVIFAPQDAFLVPLSIVWTGFFVVGAGVDPVASASMSCWRSDSRLVRIR